jgi:hypothetical protein
MTTNPTSRRVLRAVALSGAAATLAVVALQAPATATYYANIWACGDPCGYAKTGNANEDMLYGCDSYSPDGLGVYGRFILNNGQVVDVADPDGAGGSCGFADHRPTPYWTSRLQGIRRDNVASAWVYTYGLGGN